MPARAPQPVVGWVLEGYLEGVPGLFVASIPSFPYTVGRKRVCGLRLSSTGVSQVHAELLHDGEQIWVHDLDSTNGTYVNRRRIRGRYPLKEGDVLHFATVELALRMAREDTDGERTIHRSMEELPQRMSSRDALEALIAERRVDVHFQPIVDLREASWPRVGWEALGRGAAAGLPVPPIPLFDLAQGFDRAVDLSELMRVRALEEAVHLEPGATVFLNCHPLELASERLVARMAELRALAPQLELVLEIHEKAVTDVEGLRRLVGSLGEIGVRTAYDDFGAGQTRLLELVEATPAYVKFDKAWTRGIDDPSSSKRKLAETLVRLVLDFGILPVCEGVETEVQARAALDVGFSLAQGFLFGRPQPAPRAN